MTSGAPSLGQRLLATGRSVSGRLFLSAWLVYAVHLTSNVVRETYLALAIGERATFRVDPYLGLHPDLFEIPGRGAYINSNPGASLLGALPILAARPAVAVLFRLKPELGLPKPPTTYDDPRPNRTRLMNLMRERGLDVKLALAAFTVQLGLMAPLGALAAVVVFRFLSRRLGDQRRALRWALLYAFGTPILFRTAFLNQNAILAHAVLFAWVLLDPPEPETPEAPRRRWLAVGALLGVGLLCDYSAAPLALVFGGWALWEGWMARRSGGAVERAAWYALGAAGPVVLLLCYQWAAYGSPWFPAQRYMPATEFSELGASGFTLPSSQLLTRNLFDPRWGLFAFCPMLAAGLLAPLMRGRPGAPSGRAITFGLLGFVSLWLFSSANQFANLQWNTGLRYMVPAVPLLFLLAVPVLSAWPRWAAALLVVPSVVISAAVAMTREDVTTALQIVFSQGPTLPMLIVLQKTAQAYAPFLAGGTLLFALAAYAVLALMLWLLWRGTEALTHRGTEA